MQNIQSKKPNHDTLNAIRGVELIFFSKLIDGKMVFYENSLRWGSAMKGLFKAVEVVEPNSGVS